MLTVKNKNTKKWPENKRTPFLMNEYHKSFTAVHILVFTICIHSQQTSSKNIREIKNCDDKRGKRTQIHQAMIFAKILIQYTAVSGTKRPQPGDINLQAHKLYQTEPNVAVPAGIYLLLFFLSNTFCMIIIMYSVLFGKGIIRNVFVFVSQFNYDRNIEKGEGFSCSANRFVSFLKADLFVVFLLFFCQRKVVVYFR